MTTLQSADLAKSIEAIPHRGTRKSSTGKEADRTAGTTKWPKTMTALYTNAKISKALDSLSPSTACRIAEAANQMKSAKSFHRRVEASKHPAERSNEVESKPMRAVEATRHAEREDAEDVEADQECHQ